MSRNEFYNSPVAAIRHLRQTVIPSSLDATSSAMGSPLARLTPDERKQVQEDYMRWYDTWVRPALNALEKRVDRATYDHREQQRVNAAVVKLRDLLKTCISYSDAEFRVAYQERVNPLDLRKAYGAAAGAEAAERAATKPKDTP